MTPKQGWIMVGIYIVFCAALVYIMYKYAKAKQKAWTDMLDGIQKDSKDKIVDLFSTASAKTAEQLYEDVKAEVIETIQIGGKLKGGQTVEDFVKENISVKDLDNIKSKIKQTPKALAPAKNGATVPKPIAKSSTQPKDKKEVKNTTTKNNQPKPVTNEAARA